MPCELQRSSLLQPVEHLRHATHKHDLVRLQKSNPMDMLVLRGASRWHWLAARLEDPSSWESGTEVQGKREISVEPHEAPHPSSTKFPEFKFLHDDTFAQGQLLLVGSPGSSEGCASDSWTAESEAMLLPSPSGVGSVPCCVQWWIVRRGESRRFRHEESSTLTSGITLGLRVTCLSVS